MSRQCSVTYERHSIDAVILKLKSYRVGESFLSWSQNYLSDRYQRIVIREQASEFDLIEAGVQQGAVLGPLLFWTYINDLPAGLESNMKLYADDATVYIDYTDANIAHDVISKIWNILGPGLTNGWLNSVQPRPRLWMCLLNRSNLVFHRLCLTILHKKKLRSTNI